MSTIIKRGEALSLLADFLALWQGQPGTANPFSDAINLLSSHKGKRQGLAEVTQAFAEPNDMALIATNHYVTGNDQGLAMVSAYLGGEVSAKGASQPSTLLGGVLRLTLTRENGSWKISELLVNIGWVEGDSRLLSTWKLPPGQRGWRPGDLPPVLVSELDSPWVCLPDNQVEASVETRIAEAYSRYNWGIDQNDMALFKSCYTEDAKGLFPPLGPLEGLHDITGALKEFRRHWPWMQHYGVPLKIVVAEDGQHAQMWVGRLIPGHRLNEHQQQLYGAYYRIELRLEQGLWKFSWSEYVPGWLTEAQMPYHQ